MTGDVQLFMYPEELDVAPPDALAQLAYDLGCDALAVAVVYHRARRWLPRQGRAHVLGSATAYLGAAHGRYGPLRPLAADPGICEAVMALRRACDRSGVAFRAWIVPLHDERLAAQHRDAAARMLDGSANGIGLCPSAPAVVDYAAAVIADVCAQLRPDSIELEGALYPAWEPSYTLTLALEQLTPDEQRLTMQCFCPACRRLMGAEASELEHRTRAGEAPPELADVRALGVRQLLDAAAGAAHDGGATLRVFASGLPEQAVLQGLTAYSVAPADRLLFGCGALVADELMERFAGLRALVDDRPGSASLNWLPARNDGGLARDAATVAAAADGLALYNLSLVPEGGLPALAAAATSFRAAHAARVA